MFRVRTQIRQYIVRYLEWISSLPRRTIPGVRLARWTLVPNVNHDRAWLAPCPVMLCYAMPCHAKPNPVSAEDRDVCPLNLFLSVEEHASLIDILVGRASPAASPSRPDKCLEWQGQVSNKTTPTPSTSASPPGTHRLCHRSQGPGGSHPLPGSFAALLSLSAASFGFGSESGPGDRPIARAAVRVSGGYSGHWPPLLLSELQVRGCILISSTLPHCNAEDLAKRSNCPSHAHSRQHFTAQPDGTLGRKQRRLRHRAPEQTSKQRSRGNT
ncbi:hypothetical protein HDV57DRAFT_376355 [Trichoderma longibrachiatum]|uniref:Uncharacterized protein n=1 Tax=Trichoderma longibrachiatum ATCC 18648 TaxID=983965 RepID=A0A2T4BQF1_TRILO|nr:hypothetical protein M440DRAFT_1147485 [Trichoderma longibrachiatum ATCC 18648]